MTLLNGLLAFGAAAFTIPLIIHLMHRSRYQTIDWGAMHLLQSARNVNSRRVQWQQLLLLLLRCALPILLALAMARPLLQSFLSPSGPSAMSIVIVIDDSTSMFATDDSIVATTDGNSKGNAIANRNTTTTATRFSKACKSAVDILNLLPPGSNAAIILAGGRPELLSGQAPDELASQLIRLCKRTVPAGEFTYEESVRISLEWLAKSQYPKRQLVLISDFQRNEWSQQKPVPISEMSKLVTQQPMSPEIAFITVGPTSESTGPRQPNNLFVSSVDVTSTLITIEREVFISASLGNSGTTRSDNVKVSVLVDDVEIDRQEIAFAPSSTALMRTRWSPNRVGDHVVQIKILRDDDLMADNRLEHALSVQQPIGVLLVDGDRRAEAMQSEADYIRLALSPFSLLSSEKGDAFISKTISPNELSESIVKSFRAVCLCNVRELSEVQQTWLRTYVEQGNGLITFLGDKVRSEHYESWPTLANSGLRIAKFQNRAKITLDQPDGDRIRVQKIEFAPIRELSAASLSSLAEVRFEYRTPMALDPTALSKASDASVAAQFEDGQAWILESRIGMGRSVWVCSACDIDDSNLPTRSVFVPLVQKLFAFASNANRPTSNSISLAGWFRSVGELQQDEWTATDEIEVIKPDGTAVAVKLTADRQLHFSDTRLLGKYSAKLKVDDPGFSARPMFACSTSDRRSPSQESELSFLTLDEISSTAAMVKATVSENTKDFLENASPEWHGREIWTWIWTALVVCFLSEMALEQSLSPRVRTKPNALQQPLAKGTAA